MLCERKRFNYIVNTTHAAHNKPYQHSNAKPPHTLNPYSLPTPDQENPNKTQELEAINRKLVEETARQFKKLEEDVQRVEKILEDKEATLQQARKQNQELRDDLDKANDEKKILIEAIFEKDIVIKQYEEKIGELLEESRRPTPEITAEPLAKSIECIERGVGTDPIPENPPEETKSLKRKNIELQEEVFRLREELFDASNKVKVLTQEFQAYKILKEIQSLQES